jgi:hypothetical protein
MKFTLEEEKENKINFLDITITKENNNLSFDIFRKPKTTHIIIPNVSCHPREQTLAAIRYFYNRMMTYKLSPDNVQKENKKTYNIS